MAISGTRSFLGGEYSGVNTREWVLTPTDMDPAQGAGYSPPDHYCHKVVATKTCTVGKRAVRVLLEYLLFKANVRRHLACSVFLMWKGVLNTNSFPSIDNNSGSYHSAMF